MNRREASRNVVMAVSSTSRISPTSPAPRCRVITKQIMLVHTYHMRRYGASQENGEVAQHATFSTYENRQTAMRYEIRCVWQAGAREPDRQAGGRWVGGGGGQGRCERCAA